MGLPCPQFSPVDQNLTSPEDYLALIPEDCTHTFFVKGLQGYAINLKSLI